MELIPGHDDSHLHGPGAIWAGKALRRTAGVVAVHVKGGIADRRGFVAGKDFVDV